MASERKEKEILPIAISYLQNKFNRNSRNEVLEYSNIVPSRVAVVVVTLQKKEGCAQLNALEKCFKIGHILCRHRQGHS